MLMGHQNEDHQDNNDDDEEMIDEEDDNNKENNVNFASTTNQKSGDSQDLLDMIDQQGIVVKENGNQLEISTGQEAYFALLA